MEKDNRLAEFNGKRYMRVEQVPLCRGILKNKVHLKTEAEYQALPPEEKSQYYPLRMRHKEGLWSVQDFRPWLLKPVEPADAPVRLRHGDNMPEEVREARGYNHQPRGFTANDKFSQSDPLADS